MIRTSITLALLLVASACTAQTTPAPYHNSERTSAMANDTATPHVEVATLGGGCFWCVEAVFQRLEGVSKVVSGYAGGTVKDPTYEQVTAGTTGHAEVCQITFDPAVVSFEDVLQVFFTAHDPTTLNRQGNDVGPQYRSIVLYHSDKQRDVATAYIKQLSGAGTWPDPIVTEVRPFTEFYSAEQYHQNYYQQNADRNPYCSFVVRPKVEKFMKTFKDRVKDEYK